MIAATAPSQEEARAAIDAILRKHPSLILGKMTEREDLAYDLLAYVAEVGERFRAVGYEAGMNAMEDLITGTQAVIAKSGVTSLP